MAPIGLDCALIKIICDRQCNVNEPLTFEDMKRRAEQRDKNAFIDKRAGTVAECQQERSQIKNKETAMKLLRAKLYSARLEEETSRRYQARKLQIGTRGRSEKIRTYNFQQDRITDHRIGKTVHDVHRFLQGEELLEEMIVFLQQFSEQESLMDVLDSELNL